MPEPIHRYSFEGMAGAPDVEIHWTHDDQKQALAEGWYLDERDGRILDDDDSGLNFPAGWAARHVRAKGSEGSELHIRAMILDAWGAIAAWEVRYRETTKQMGDWHAG